MSGTRITKRQVWIVSAESAGYHSDSRSFTRLLIEARVNRETLNQAWFRGQAKRQAGVRCTCLDCREIKTA
jgi:hypothetical protein